MRLHFSAPQTKAEIRTSILALLPFPARCLDCFAYPGTGKIEFTFLHDIVHYFAGHLYHGYSILSAAPFRVTRNSNLYLREEESRSILDTVDKQLHHRRKGAAVRLEINAGANSEIVERLRSNFGLEPWQIFRVDGPVNLSRFSICTIKRRVRI